MLLSAGEMAFFVAFGILANICLAFILKIFMGVFFEARKTKTLFFVLSYVLFVFLINASLFLFLLNIVINVPSWLIVLFDNYWRVVITAIASIFVITLNYDAPMTKRIFAAIIMHTTLGAVSFIVNVGIVRNLLHYEILTTNTVSHRIVIDIAGQSVMLVAVLFLRQFKYIRKARADLPVFWAFGIFVGVLLQVLWNISEIHLNFEAFDYFDALIINAINMLVIFSLFFIYNALLKTYEIGMEAATHSKEKEYYLAQCRLMQESSEKIRAIKHDIRLHLVAIKDFSATGKSNDAEQYINKLLNDIGEAEMYSQTGNLAFDSIINHKLKDAKADGISLDLRLDVPPKLNVDVADIVIIIGNLLDNALEAVAKVEDKKIKLDVNFEKSTLYVKVENTFDDKVKFLNGSITSLKSGNEHGHGLKNIKRSVEKYNGHIKITHSNGIFHVALILLVEGHFYG